MHSDGVKIIVVCSGIIQLCVTKKICDDDDDADDDVPDDEQIEQKWKMCAFHFWGLT